MPGNWICKNCDLVFNNKYKLHYHIRATHFKHLGPPPPLSAQSTPPTPQIQPPQIQPTPPLYPHPGESHDYMELFRYNNSPLQTNMTTLQHITQTNRSPPEECIICMTAPSNTAFIGCGHIICCHKCASTLLEKEDNRCPMCRQTIDSLLKVYL